MKITALIFLLVCVVASMGHPGKHGHGKPCPYGLPEVQYMQQCIKQEKVEVNKIGEPINKDDPKWGCVAFCMMNQTSRITANGDILVEKFPKNMKAIAEQCSGKATEGDKCAKAGAFGECFLQGLQDKTKQDVEDCAAETDTNVDVSDPQKFFETKKDDKYACFHRCLMIKNGRITEDNEFTEEAEPKCPETRKKCVEDNQQDDICIQAIRRDACVIKAMIQHRSDGKKEKGNIKNKDKN